MNDKLNETVSAHQTEVIHYKVNDSLEGQIKSLNKQHASDDKLNETVSAHQVEVESLQDQIIKR